MFGNTVSMEPQDRALADILQGLADTYYPGVITSLRRVRPEDEDALTPEEHTPLAGAVRSVRSASGAARIAARDLMRQFHVVESSIVKQINRSPKWPSELSGSIAHDCDLAVVAIGKRRIWRSLGIDIEPAKILPSEVLDLALSSFEKLQVDGDLVQARLVFCVKEAVFKATHPVDGIFLEPHDVEVDLRTGIARTTTGYILPVATLRHKRLIALTAVKAEVPST